MHTLYISRAWASHLKGKLFSNISSVQTMQTLCIRGHFQLKRPSSAFEFTKKKKFISKHFRPVSAHLPTPLILVLIHWPNCRAYQLWFIYFQNTSVSTLSQSRICQLCIFANDVCLNAWITDLICWAFLHCEPLYDELSAWLLEGLQNCTGHTCWNFLHLYSYYL